MGSTQHVLFLSRPNDDHLYLTLPIAEELGRRGYAVTFATSDPFAEEDAASGVVLLRHGRDERALLDLPAFQARGPVDLVVCDPQGRDAAHEWGVPVVVAHTNLAGGPVGWPAERSFGEEYVYVHPAGRGTVFGWQPSGRQRVVAVAHDTLPVPALASAFGGTDWQVVLTGADPGGLPANFVVDQGFGAAEHADVLLTDGGLPGISAGLRYGTPLVLVPGSPQERRNAGRVVELGLGAQARPEALSRVVARVAVDEATSAEARVVRALVRESGRAGRVSDILESVLDSRVVRAA